MPGTDTGQRGLTSRHRQEGLPMSDDAIASLTDLRSVALVDWPVPSLPEALARSGRDVWVKGGPDERDWSRWEIQGGLCVRMTVGVPPESVDLLYAFRPLLEF